MGALGAASLLPGFLRAEQPRRGLRVAYLTDMHVIAAGRPSDEGIAHTVKHLLARTDKPDLVLTGGDNLTGTVGLELSRALELRARWIKLYRDQVKTPTLHCVGNHDVWGWNKPNSKATGSEPLYGKNWAREQFQMDKVYYSTERGGWKFIVLDTVREFENSYQGGLDDEQFEWLKGEVKTKLPTLVLCHIPVTGISPLLVDARPEAASFAVPFGSLFRDQLRVTKLFNENTNVKLVLGGHTHFEETLSFNGITYYNGGAVSGAWWRPIDEDLARRTDGALRLPRAACSYSMLDLRPDGTFNIERVMTNFPFPAGS